MQEASKPTKHREAKLQLIHTAITSEYKITFKTHLLDMESVEIISVTRGHTGSP